MKAHKEEIEKLSEEGKPAAEQEEPEGEAMTASFLQIKCQGIKTKLVPLSDSFRQRISKWPLH